MRRIKQEIGTNYDDKIAFYIVGTDPSESLERLEADRERIGLPWLVAYADSNMLDTLRIYTQASKIAFNGDGTITHRYGFGNGDYDSWNELFDDIAAGKG